MDTNRLTMGNVMLDLTTYELSTPTGSFRLTGKEFQMMEMLLSNQRRLIPTERFLEKIWGYDTDAEVHVVWVYISYLRKKLASLGAHGADSRCPQRRLFAGGDSMIRKLRIKFILVMHVFHAAGALGDPGHCQRAQLRRNRP